LDDGRTQSAFTITGCTEGRDAAGNPVEVLSGTIDTPFFHNLPGYEERQPPTATSFEMGATLYSSGTNCTYNVFVDATDLAVDPTTSRYQGPTTLTIGRNCTGGACSTVYSGTGYQS
jgi:hypothetical protein